MPGGGRAGAQRRGRHRPVRCRQGSGLALRARAAPRGEQSLAEVGEAGFLRRLRRRLGAAGVTLGLGDDAALLARLGPEAVVTTDMLVEHVDFERAWAGAADIGHKAAAVNLSDLAAMGARPRGLVASIALPAATKTSWAMRLLVRLDAVGRRFGAPLVGGDMSSIVGPVVVSVTALGQVAARAAMRRGRGRAGDVVVVTGPLGGAAAGLHCLQTNTPAPARLRRAQLRPEPRVALGRRLSASGLVRACIDISDGLGRDVLHLAGPGCGVDLDPETLPLPLPRLPAALNLPSPLWQLALWGGEDFELALAVAPRQLARVLALGRRAGATLHPVGRIAPHPGLCLAGQAARAAGTGFDHFRPGHAKF